MTTQAQRNASVREALLLRAHQPAGVDVQVHCPSCSETFIWATKLNVIEPGDAYVLRCSVCRTALVMAFDLTTEAEYDAREEEADGPEG